MDGGLFLRTERGVKKKWEKQAVKKRPGLVPKHLQCRRWGGLTRKRQAPERKKPTGTAPRDVRVT